MQPQFRPPGPERPGMTPSMRPPAGYMPGTNFPPPTGPSHSNPYMGAPYPGPPIQKMSNLSLAPNQPNQNQSHLNSPNPNMPTPSNGMAGVAARSSSDSPFPSEPTAPPLQGYTQSARNGSNNSSAQVSQSSMSDRPPQFVTAGHCAQVSHTEVLPISPSPGMPTNPMMDTAAASSVHAQNPNMIPPLSMPGVFPQRPEMIPSQTAAGLSPRMPPPPGINVPSPGIQLRPGFNAVSPGIPGALPQPPVPGQSMYAPSDQRPSLSSGHSSNLGPVQTSGVQYPPTSGAPPTPNWMGPNVPPRHSSASFAPPVVGGAGMRPLSPGNRFSTPGMAPPNPGMGPPNPGMGPPNPGMGPPTPGMGPLTPGMGPLTPGMGPLTPGMGPLTPGMRPPPPGMAPLTPGMAPLTPGMGPPNPGMGPLTPGMRPPPPGMGLSTPGMRPPPPGMGLSTQGMRPSTTGMNTMTASSIPGSQYPPGGMNTAPTIPPQPGMMAPPQGGMQSRYPGSAPNPGGVGAYPQSQGRKLNPDDMPSPLQVMEDDQENRSGEFLTNEKGGYPPLVTTKFIVRDGGNASPRFMRSTMYNVPSTPEMMKKCAVPFGLVISPFADLQPGESPLYLGTSLTTGPVRCNRCKAYMSPLMMFMDGGRRFQCLLCKQANEVPSDYYCHMDSQGARADKYQRPELCLGSYEYVATPEYCTNKQLPKEPAFIFVMEMSQMMLQRGIINLLCQNMKEILKNLPKDEVPGQDPQEFSKVHVGFITYDSSVHFYKLSGLSPEMCVVCDKENMFVPVPDGILCDVQQVSDNIEKLMESIPQNFQTARETSGNLYGAIQAGMSALKASGRAGKLFVFHSSLPQTEGLGKLKSREDRKVLGTDKEKSVLAPQNNHYNNLAQDLVTAGCGVDLYLFNESYIDMATIGQVPRLTGGQCHKYTYFTLNKDGPRLLEDLQINVGRNIAFDSVMRVRTSTGVRPVEFFGHFFMSNTHDIELATLDSSKAVAVEIKHDDKITEEDGVYIQAALLYTSCGGQRRLRIINLSLNVCNQMADMYKSSDLDTIMNILSRESIFKLSTTSSKQIKENLVNRAAETLACYRKNCASPSSAGQLILPEQMKLLPLYINCLSRSDALVGGSDLTCDDRSWHMFQLSTMNVAASLAYLYPRLLPLMGEDSEGISLPTPVRTSYNKLRPDGVFLLENGLFMFIWVGSGTPSDWMNDVFGVAAPHQLDPVMTELPELNNPTSERVRQILDSVRKERGLQLRLFVVPQQGKHELVLRNYLIEDAGVAGAPGYVEFLCHVHKEIRTILS